MSRQEKTSTLPVLTAFLRECNSLLGDVLVGNEEGPWHTSDVRKLESQIAQLCEDEQARQFLRLLRKAALRWSSVSRVAVELPRIPSPPYQYRNPFNGDVSAQIAQYEDAKQLLSEWLHELRQLPGPPGEPGHLLRVNTLVMSAVVYGGLFSRPSLVALLRAIPEMASRTLIVDERLHIELSLSLCGLPNAELRRWQPDPLSATLWANTPADSASALLVQEKTGSGERPPSDATVYKRFGDQFRAALSGAKSSLTDLDSLLNAAYVIAHTQMPPIIARYASREIVSHSLARPTLARFTDSLFPQCEPPSATNLANNQTTGKRLRRDRSDDPLWLQAVLESVEHADAGQELKRLGTESREQLVKTFSAFAAWLRTVSSRSGPQYTVKAMVEIIGVLGRYLGPFLEDLDPTDQDAESMSELYWQAMEGTGPSTVNRTLKGELSRAIAEFERYLSVVRPDTAVEKAKFPWYPNGLADVDANPTSHEDYHKLLKRIEDEWPSTSDPDTRTIAWLLVVFGFRCGLRRMEALGLQVQDVLVRGQGELLVRPTPSRKLKSVNAARRIPLGILLSPMESERLRRWKEKRLTDPGIGPTDCLFGIAGRGPVNEKIFNQINRLMRPEGEPDHGMEHFHELRKGFGSWLFTAMVLADAPPPIPVLFPKLTETSVWLSDAARLKARIFRHTHPSRKSAFMLSRLLGHSSPNTSLENYVFVADYLLSTCLNSSEVMRPTQRLVKNACGLDPDTSQKIVEKAASDAIAVRLWRNKTNPGFLEPLRQREANQPASALTTPNWVDRTSKFLNGIAAGKEDEKSLAQRLGLDEMTAEGILERAKYLAELLLYPKEYRHRMGQPTQDAAQPRNEKRRYCPVRPSASHDKIPEQLSVAFVKMARNGVGLKVMQSALSMYVSRVNRENYVRFEDPSQVGDVRRFLHFLQRLDIPRRSLSFVSGDPEPDSDLTGAWKKELRVPVEPRPKGGDFDLKSAIYIRPNEKLNAKVSIGRAGFRFLLVIAFIAFGELPMA